MQVFDGEIRFGVHSGQQDTTLEAYLHLWRAAEDLGFDWASVFDHFLPIQSDPSGPCFEGTSLLAALAASTSHIRCGMLVAGNTYRHPAVMANIAATIDHVSGGRLELGMGAGWYQREHAQYGIEYHTVGQRIRMLGESLRIMKSLWTSEKTTFSGNYYELEQAACEPKPIQKPHMPLWVGGSGEQLTLGVVAESADGWNTFLIDQETYRHKLNVLNAHCQRFGRTIGDIRKSLVVETLVGETELEVETRLPEVCVLRNKDPEAFRREAVIGTPEQVVDQLLPYIEMGVSDFLIAARPPADMRTLELVANHVAPAVKDEGVKKS